jgi:hypothetical protein
MLIRETFATTIQERIEPVVKVADRHPAVLLGELKNLVITPQWETYLHRILEAYTDAFDRDDEQGIGIWISGFFGSGKSLLMKELGVLLEGGELLDQPVHQVFLSRLPSHNEERADLERYLAICQRKLSTSVIGGNLHAQLSSSNDPLALIVFKLFAREHGYTHNWPLAWAVEYQLDLRGLSAEFHRVASELSGIEWSEVANDPDFYNDILYQAAATVLPDHFNGGPEAVERAVMSAVQSGITSEMLIDRLRRWCIARDSAGRRHKLLLQLDELGQWIASGNANERIMQVQALVETAAQAASGRIWIAVTAHGDVQALQQNVQQEQYAKISQRFSLQCKLSNEDINLVVEERLLRKTQSARIDLTQRFTQRSGEITDLGSLQQAQRVFSAPDAENFALFYPYLPWTVAVIPNVVKGIAQATGRDEALTGSNRTMIGVVQGGIIDTPGLLVSPVGRILCLADLYDQLASDAPIETRTDINRIISTVSDATTFTTEVARALYLLGQVPYIPCTLENVARALVTSLDTNLAALRMQVKDELERLIAAGYAKQVAETSIFLNTQQRSFQDKVRSRQEELSNQTYELSQKLQEYHSEDALRFDQVSLAGREIRLRLEIDGRVARNPSVPVTIHVSSPFQRALDPQVADDTAMKQRSLQDPDTIFFRLAETKGLRRALALALSTEEVANQVRTSQANSAEAEVAQQARQVDLPSYKNEVRRLLTQSVRGGVIFFRGSTYQLLDGDGASDAVRNTLSQLLPSIYARFAEVTYRIINEETAVKAALNNNTTNTDLQNLGVYKNDGTLNESHALISTLRGSLPQASDDQAAIPADQLRGKFERPPFGWDGNCIKVALAILLRSSACRLIINGRTITDPNSPEALQYLTKEQSFKALRIQGIRTDFGMPQLQSIRGYMETIFGVKSALVPATLNTVLGEQLTELAKQAQGVKNWAATARCPLPLAFESSSSLVSELLDSAMPSVRLPHFQEQWETLHQYTQVLDNLTMFQREHGTEFLAVRDFFSSMLNAEGDLPDLRRFISDWRAVTNERSVTETDRWNELLKTYHAAHQAVTNQIAAWREEARKNFTEMQAHLKERVQAAGVPAEQADAEVAALAVDLQSVQEHIEQPNPGFSEARNLNIVLGTAQMNLQRKVQEMRARYQPIDQKPQQEIRLYWQDLVGTSRISSQDDLEQMLGKLRTSITPELEQQKIVIIE